MASICFDKQSVKILCNVQLWTDIIPQKFVTILQTVNQKNECALLVTKRYKYDFFGILKSMIFT